MLINILFQDDIKLSICLPKYVFKILQIIKAINKINIEES